MGYFYRQTRIEATSQELVQRRIGLSYLYLNRAKLINRLESLQTLTNLIIYVQISQGEYEMGCMRIGKEEHIKAYI